MSHVDQGALHAYLDGALDEYPATQARRVREHLESCGECAERLDAERRIRREASEILSLAAPEVEVPSLEELRAYVQATRPTVGRPRLRLYRLGWAASVVLALGVGWMARGGGLDEAVAPETLAVPGDFADQFTERASAVDPAANEGPVPRELLVAEGAGFVVPAESEVLAEARRIEGEAAGGRVVGDLEQALPDEVMKVEEEPALELRALVVQVEVDSSVGVDVPESLGAARVSEEAVALADRRNRDDSLVQREGQQRAGGAGGALATRAVQEFRDSIAEPAPQPARGAAAGQRQAADAVVSRVDATAAVIPADIAAVAPAQAPAAEEDEVDAMAVPGLAVLSYANLEEGTTPRGVHVVQVFENGDILDVYHLPQGVEPSVLPPLAGGRNEARRQRESGWIVLRAPRSVETLEELLARLAPER